MIEGPQEKESMDVDEESVEEDEPMGLDDQSTDHLLNVGRRGVHASGYETQPENDGASSSSDEEKAETERTSSGKSLRFGESRCEIGW